MTRTVNEPDLQEKVASFLVGMLNITGFAMNVLAALMIFCTTKVSRDSHLWWISKNAICYINSLSIDLDSRAKKATDAEVREEMAEDDAEAGVANIYVRTM